MQKITTQDQVMVVLDCDYQRHCLAQDLTDSQELDKASSPTPTKVDPHIALGVGQTLVSL